MKPTPWILALFLAFAAASPLRADFLTLTTNENLTWSSLANPSPTFTVGINNPTNTSELLFGWSLGLKIVGENGAVGLKFSTATIPTSNYILNNDSLGLTGTYTPPSTIMIPTISDFDLNGTGAGLKPMSSFNLLSLTFTAAAGTQGTFDIEAIGDGITGSFWVSDDIQAQDFANVPFHTSGVMLGTVTIPAATGAVPEPSSALLVLLAAGPMAWLARRAGLGLARRSGQSNSRIGSPPTGTTAIGRLTRSGKAASRSIPSRA